jgi:hypothetical protein
MIDISTHAQWTKHLSRLQLHRETINRGGNTCGETPIPTRNRSKQFIECFIAMLRSVWLESINGVGKPQMTTFRATQGEAGRNVFPSPLCVRRT